MNHTIARVLSWGAILMVAWWGPSIAIAQEYPLHDGPLQVDTPNVQSGDTVRVTGDGFEPGGRVTITLESEAVVLATTEADTAGSISIEVAIPPDAPGGDHQIKATGPAPGGGVLILTTDIQVAAATPAVEPKTDSRAPAMVLTFGIAVAATAALGTIAWRIWA